MRRWRRSMRMSMVSSWVRLSSRRWKRASPRQVCCAGCAAEHAWATALKLRLVNSRGAPTLGITLLLASLSMISPLSIDTFLPSLPTIAKDFNISSWQAQQLITAYLAPFALFSLVHGSLSDALGRRKVVIGGLALYTFGSIGCFLAPNLGLLLFC